MKIAQPDSLSFFCAKRHVWAMKMRTRPVLVFDLRSLSSLARFGPRICADSKTRAHINDRTSQVETFSRHEPLQTAYVCCLQKEV